MPQFQGARVTAGPRSLCEERLGTSVFVAPQRAHRVQRLRRHCEWLIKEVIVYLTLVSTWITVVTAPRHVRPWRRCSDATAVAAVGLLRSERSLGPGPAGRGRRRGVGDSFWGAKGAPRQAKDTGLHMSIIAKALKL